MSKLTKTTSVRLPTELLGELDDAAARAIRNRTQQIAYYVREGLRRDREARESAEVGGA